MKALKLILPLSILLIFACHEDSDHVHDVQADLQHHDVKEFAGSAELLAKLTAPKNLSKGRSSGSRVALYSAEYIYGPESDEAGSTVFFTHRGNKQLDADFVPEQSIDGTTDVSYYVDNNRATTDMTEPESEGAIDASMDTWDEVKCSDLGLTKIPFDGRPTGFIAALVNFPGGSFDYVADVTQCGWLPEPFYSGVLGSSNILAVTFTIIFIDENNLPLDADNDGKTDVAWREIYYNEGYTWSNDGSGIDLETVSLHEAGHGLSQAHFGKVHGTSNGKVHFSPRAVMNAGYSGINRTINGTDKAGHCSNWGNWPNN